VETGFRKRSCSDKELHDPEKWKPVFGKDHAPTKSCVIPKSGNRFSEKITRNQEITKEEVLS
jgi:hypothetical protein